MQTLSAIVAMARNRVIGTGNALPWHLSEDLKFFKRTTSGHPIVVGRKTFASFGRPLPGRLNVVITRDPKAFAAEAKEDVVFVASLGDALALCAARREKWGDEVFIAGGGEIYRAALPLLSKIYLTTIDADYEGDVSFPELPAGAFAATEEQHFTEPMAYSRALLLRK